jgi:hypothetical protein
MYTDNDKYVNGVVETLLEKFVPSLETHEDGSVKIISYKETWNTEKLYDFSIEDAKALWIHPPFLFQSICSF